MDRASTSLLLVDFQRVFAGPTGPWAVPGYDAALAGARTLLGTYAERAALTRFVPHEDPPGSWVDYYAAFPFAREPGSRRLWELADGLVDIAPQAPVLDVPTMGKWTPEVDAALGRPATLLLAGVATECCVLATAIAASDAGVRVRLVADACAGGTAQDHEHALAVAAAFAPQVQVVRLADLCGQNN